VVRGLIDRIPRAAPAAAPAVTAFEPEVVPTAAMAAPDDLDLESPALDLDLGREEMLPVTVYARRPVQSYGALWAVAAVLVCAVTLAGVANIKHVGAFRPRLQTSAPQPGSNAVPQPVPDNVAGTISGTVPRIVPGTESRTVPGVASHTVAGTTGATVPEPADAAGADLVSAVDAQQRPIFSPAFASNGAAMFFHTGKSSDEHSALAMVSGPIDGADLRVMTIVDDGARNYHVQPSPDGRLVAFDSDRDGERGVYLANRDGTAVRRISGPGYAAVPTWSPDGRRIAYVRAEPDHPRVWNLWLQDVESDHLTQLTSYRFGQPWSASWFPDDRRICYTHEDKIVLMDLETRRTWTFNSPMEGRQVRTPAVSPDGTKVIFQVRRDGAWILDLTDRSMRRVLTDPTAEEFAWAPDGRRIAFHSRRDGQWGIYILHQR
jgi:Tol biopolymer transport system component